MVIYRIAAIVMAAAVAGGAASAADSAASRVAIGPAVGPLATVGCACADQIAATILVALGEDWHAFNPPIGAPLFALPAPALGR